MKKSKSLMSRHKELLEKYNNLLVASNGLSLQYTELAQNYDQLAGAYKILQRIFKSVLLDGENNTVSFSTKITKKYLEHELDEMELVVKEIDDRIEISLVPFKLDEDEKCE